MWKSKHRYRQSAIVLPRCSVWEWLFLLRAASATSVDPVVLLGPVAEEDGVNGFYQDE